MNARTLIVSLVFAFAPLGCSDGPRRFDSSTDAKADESLIRMINDAGSPADGQRIANACRGVARYRSGAPRSGAGFAETFQSLHGMTAAEIMAEAIRIRDEISEENHLDIPKGSPLP